MANLIVIVNILVYVVFVLYYSHFCMNIWMPVECLWTYFILSSECAYLKNRLSQVHLPPKMFFDSHPNDTTQSLKTHTHTHTQPH